MKRGNVNSKTKVLFGLATVLFFIGVFAGIRAGREIHFYYESLWFSFILSVFGFVLAALVSLRFFSGDNILEMKARYMTLLKVMITIPFVGGMLYFGNYLNKDRAVLRFHEKAKILAKKERDVKNGRNYLVLNTNGRRHEVKCSEEYWQAVSQGERINLDVFVGALGFEYLVLHEYK